MTRKQSLRSDDRGVSTAVNHVLAIGITAILIAGLITAAGGLLESQRQQAAQSELKTIGNRVANQIAEADRIVENGGPPESVRIEIEQPGKVAGQTYSVFLNDTDSGDGHCVDANARQPNPEDDNNWCLRFFHEAVPNDWVEVPVEVDDGVASGTDCIEMSYRGSGTIVIEADDDPSGCSP